MTDFQAAKKKRPPLGRVVPIAMDARLGDTMVHAEALAQVFDQAEADQSFSGVALVTQAEDVLFEKAYGFASRQLRVPNTVETKFHIASMTKMFIAMTALILSEQQRLDLHEKPATYLPELAALDKDITIHHLLSHTSGIQDVYDVPDLLFETRKLIHEQGSLLTYLAHLPQTFRPGEGWSYSSTGYILMGYLMERVTGMSFGEMLSHYVLAPLSMTNTGHDRPLVINPGRAYGHTYEDGQLVNARNDRLSDFPDAPGELYSTAPDMKKWCDAMFNCPLVAPHTLQLMLTPYGKVDESTGYGYGWFLAPRLRAHGGGTPGFVSRIRQFPEQQVSVVLLSNCDTLRLEPIITAVDSIVLG
ncbi:MAG TPA: serine hydrolase domain-containing protein [Ktedonobacterales bacterium]